jgi:hypothetical protein
MYEVDYHCGHTLAYEDARAGREIEALVAMSEHGECPGCREKRIRVLLKEIRGLAANQ